MRKAMKFLWQRRKLIGGLVVLAGIGFWWYSSKNKKVELVTWQPEIREIIESLDVSGNVDAREKADLRFAAASKLTWLPIKEGDEVKKWQAIAAVDARTLQKQLEYNQNLHGIQFRTSEGVFDSADRYDASGLTDTERRSVENAELSMRNSAITVEMQDIALKNSTMVSPIAGIVTRIDQPNVGALMLPTEAIQVINPTSMYFAVVIDEADIGKVKVGQEANIILDAFPNETLRAQITQIAFTPSQSQSGGLGYKISLSLPGIESGLDLRMAMSGDAKIILNKNSQIMAIPTDAIVERDGVKTVEVLKQDKPEKVNIETGISDGDYTEVVSGLSQQDVVVLPAEAK